MPNGVKVYRAICAAFPEVTSFGGRRGGDDFHGSGQAVDNMISDSAAGWRLANWVRANASKLGVSEVIYSQKIWTVQRPARAGAVCPTADRPPPTTTTTCTSPSTEPPGRGAEARGDTPL